MIHDEGYAMYVIKNIESNGVDPLWHRCICKNRKTFDRSMVINKKINKNKLFNISFLHSERFFPFTEFIKHVPSGQAPLLFEQSVKI